MKALTPALKEGNTTAKVLGPFVRALEGFSGPAVPAGRMQGELQSNLRDSGTYESLLKLIYVGAASTSRFDSVSHIDPSHLVASPCAPYESTHDDQCDYHWVKQHGTPARSHRHAAGRHHARRPAAKPARPSAPSAPSPAAPKLPSVPKLPKPPSLPPVPKLPPLPGTPQVPATPPPPSLDPLLDYLLG